MRAAGQPFTAAVTLALCTTACATPQPMRLAGCAASTRPVIVASEGREASTTLDVLTFNVEGLGWPARRNRAPALRRIGETLRDLNASGRAPDVVLVQEMFSPAAVRAIEAAGYPNIVSGPTRTQRRRFPVHGRLPGPFLWNKGETGFHLTGSGLAILSRYPITAGQSEPFGRRRCAGIDCLSNKGMLRAQIAIPGVPGPVELINTHLNSRGASRVPAERNAAAHALQVDDLSRFVEATVDADAPIILGGDFNMRRAPDRFERFESGTESFTLVHRHCVGPKTACDVRLSWDGDEPWMDTQDLQLFSDGEQVSITPVAVEAMFDGTPGSPRLSDHDGFRVSYRLSWPTPAADLRPPSSWPKPSCARP